MSKTIGICNKRELSSDTTSEVSDGIQSRNSSFDLTRRSSESLLSNQNNRIVQTPMEIGNLTGQDYIDALKRNRPDLQSHDDDSLKEELFEHLEKLKHTLGSHETTIEEARISFLEEHQSILSYYNGNERDINKYRDSAGILTHQYQKFLEALTAHYNEINRYSQEIKDNYHSINNKGTQQAIQDLISKVGTFESNADKYWSSTQADYNYKPIIETKLKQLEHIKKEDIRDREETIYTFMNHANWLANKIKNDQYLKNVKQDISFISKSIDTFASFTETENIETGSVQSGTSYVSRENDFDIS